MQTPRNPMPVPPVFQAAVAALLLVTLALPACKDEGAGSADPEAHKVSEPPSEEPAPPSPKPAAEAGTDDEEDGEALTPDVVARLAVVAGKLGCAEKRYEAGQPRDEAIAEILDRSGLTREAYEAKLKLAKGDDSFKAAVSEALSLCPESPTPGSAAERALRDKLKALAVASQCMIKAGKTGDQMTSVMMAQYQAYDISVETYTREMARLANDRDFQDEVRQAVDKCPGKPAEAVASADAVGSDDAGETGDAEGQVAAADAGPTPEGEGGDDQGEGEGEGDEEGEGDTPPDKPDKPDKPRPRYQGTWVGTVAGRIDGRLTLRVRGKAVSATVVLGGNRFTARGQISGTTVRFGGRKGRNFAQFIGKVKGNRMSGRVNGTVRPAGMSQAKKVRGSWVVRRK